MKLLLVEDEKDLSESIIRYLESEGFLVESVGCFNDAQERIALYEYDCVVVDIGLPGGSGLDLIRQLKKSGAPAGIIVVSARNALEDKLSGLEIGADDYLAKPFHLSELNARIKSIIRRRKLEGGKVLTFHEITLLFDNRQVQVCGEEVSLTRKEYDLLLYFMMNKGKVLEKEAIAEHLWGDYMGLEADSFDFIYTHIKNLRRKLMEKGAGDYIRTVYGLGYKFSES